MTFILGIGLFHIVETTNKTKKYRNILNPNKMFRHGIKNLEDKQIQRFARTFLSIYTTT